jgi:hydrogenase maturation protease
MSQTASTGVLVIGFGNELRRDDGIGPEVARHIDAMSLPNVHVLIVQQLLPELSELIAKVDRVIFVDAFKESREDPVVIQPIYSEGDSDAASTLSTHRVDPRLLISLARVLFGSAAQAWLVTIRGEDFGPGAGLSTAGKRRAQQACQQVMSLIPDGAAEAERSHPRCASKDQGWQ